MSQESSIVYRHMTHRIRCLFIIFGIFFSINNANLAFAGSDSDNSIPNCARLSKEPARLEVTEPLPFKPGDMVVNSSARNCLSHPRCAVSEALSPVDSTWQLRDGELFRRFKCECGGRATKKPREGGHPSPGALIVGWKLTDCSTSMRELVHGIRAARPDLFGATSSLRFIEMDSSLSRNWKENLSADVCIDNEQSNDWVPLELINIYCGNQIDGIPKDALDWSPCTPCRRPQSVKIFPGPSGVEVRQVIQAIQRIGNNGDTSCTEWVHAPIEHILLRFAVSPAYTEELNAAQQGECKLTQDSLGINPGSAVERFLTQKGVRLDSESLRRVAKHIVVDNRGMISLRISTLQKETQPAPQCSKLAASSPILEVRATGQYQPSKKGACAAHPECMQGMHSDGMCHLVREGGRMVCRQDFLCEGGSSYSDSDRETLAELELKTKTTTTVVGLNLSNCYPKGLPGLIKELKNTRPELFSGTSRFEFLELKRESGQGWKIAESSKNSSARRHHRHMLLELPEAICSKPIPRSGDRYHHPKTHIVFAGCTMESGAPSLSELPGNPCYAPGEAFVVSLDRGRRLSDDARMRDLLYEMAYPQRAIAEIRGKPRIVCTESINALPEDVMLRFRPVPDHRGIFEDAIAGECRATGDTLGVQPQTDMAVYLEQSGLLAEKRTLAMALTQARLDGDGQIRIPLARCPSLVARNVVIQPRPDFLPVGRSANQCLVRSECAGSTAVQPIGPSRLGTNHLDQRQAFFQRYRCNYEERVPASPTLAVGGGTPRPAIFVGLDVGRCRQGGFSSLVGELRTKWPELSREPFPVRFQYRVAATTTTWTMANFDPKSMRETKIQERTVPISIPELCPDREVSKNPASANPDVYVFYCGPLDRAIPSGTDLLDPCEVSDSQMLFFDIQSNWPRIQNVIRDAIMSAIAFQHLRSPLVRTEKRSCEEDIIVPLGALDLSFQAQTAFLQRQGSINAGACIVSPEVLGIDSSREDNRAISNYLSTQRIRRLVRSATLGPERTVKLELR